MCVRGLKRIASRSRRPEWVSQTVSTGLVVILRSYIETMRFNEDAIMRESHELMLENLLQDAGGSSSSSSGASATPVTATSPTKSKESALPSASPRIARAVSSGIDQMELDALDDELKVTTA